VVDLGGEARAAAGNVGAVLTFVHEFRASKPLLPLVPGNCGDPITVARAPLKYSYPMRISLRRPEAKPMSRPAPIRRS